ncbi:IQ motif and ankyrin repeat domain-containing protein 1 isoform X3 [Equus quagga]|uniref:IQ motif and ankyrin repeat domain-containing protein 1 isoform X3 n=1 Tax=Equus quagga TaxID=89248 RepID=UPI001EE1F2FE|nr:IQ motif and ankyrin repeat domain-containing protein 1 isoform X3 [Equus quagga]
MSSKKWRPKAATGKWQMSLPGAKPRAAAGSELPGAPGGSPSTAVLQDLRREELSCGSEPDHTPGALLQTKRSVLPQKATRPLWPKGSAPGPRPTAELLHLLKAIEFPQIVSGWHN